MAPRNRKDIDIKPNIAPILRHMMEQSLHRLPVRETQENLIEILDKYIETNGEDREAGIYLKSSSFIQTLIRRSRSAKKSCTVENLHTIFSYMQANGKDPVVLDKRHLKHNNPLGLIDFVDMHMPDELTTYTEWKLLFAILEQWDLVDSKSRPNYNGYEKCIHAQVYLIPQTRSLMIDIRGSYGKIVTSEDGYDYCDDDFTITNAIVLFGRQTQDQEYIRDCLAYLAKESKMDIFSLFELDPVDVEEWIKDQKA